MLVTFKWLSLVSITPLQRNHAIYIFLVVFSFLRFSYCYWRAHLDKQVLCTRNQLKIYYSHVSRPNSYVLCDSWNNANRPHSVFNVASLGATKSYLNVTFGGEVSKTVAIVLLLWWIILYRAKYCPRSVVLPNRLSLKSNLRATFNRGWSKAEKCFFVATRPAKTVSQKPGTNFLSLYFPFFWEFAT
jgi:hypothetical protein